MDCDFENIAPPPQVDEVGVGQRVEGELTAARAKELLQRDVDDAHEIASKFSRYYYELMEKKPHKVGQLYLENSVLQWDGNPIVTRESIQKFIEQLPSLTFNLASLDYHSIHAAAVGDRKSYVIKTAGQYRASGAVRPFTQQVIIIADGDKWRIAADDFRSQV